MWGSADPLPAMNSLTNWLSGLGDVGKGALASMYSGHDCLLIWAVRNNRDTLFAQTRVDTLPYLMGGVGGIYLYTAHRRRRTYLLAPRSTMWRKREGEIYSHGCVGDHRRSRLLCGQRLKSW